MEGMMASLNGSQYCFDLNEHDVLCGRGSGPNDRVGNIEFRNLVMSRKAEYLAAPSRDAKGRIAMSIVETVRARGGRFLKKLNTDQAKEAGFKRGVTVYELADEPTVLEKAKQTLRQNRAEFVKKGGAPSGAGGAVAAAPVTTPSPSISLSSQGANSATTSTTAQQFTSPSLGGMSNNSTPSIPGSLNPIALGDASVALDSMQRPNMSANTAQQLNHMFASNISSVTNPGSVTSMSNGMGMNGQSMPMASAAGSDYNSVLSMNTAELAAAMGNYQNMANMGSGASAQAFGQLLQEYNNAAGGNVENNQALMQQYEELRAQQAQIELLQQQLQPDNQNAQPFANGQAQPQLQFQPQQGSEPQPQMPPVQSQPLPQVQQNTPQSQDQESSDVFSSLLRQYNATAEQYNTLGDQAVQVQQMYGPQSQQPQAEAPLNAVNYADEQQQLPQQPVQGMPNAVQSAPSSNNNNLRDSMLNQLSSGLTADQQMLFDQFQQMQKAMYQWSSEKQEQEQQQQQQQQQQQLLLQAGNQSISHLDAGFAVEGGKPAYQDSFSVLNDSQATLPSGSLSTTSYRDTTTVLNDYEPTKKQPKDEGGEGENNAAPVFHQYERRPSRRPSRRSTLGRDNRSGGRANKSSNNDSLRMSGISLEPTALDEDSLKLSFLSSQRLARTLDDMSTTSVGMSGTSAGWGKDSMKSLASFNTSFKSKLDSSMLSLMSMSLSEIAPELLPKADLKRESHKEEEGEDDDTGGESVGKEDDEKSGGDDNSIKGDESSDDEGEKSNRKAHPKTKGKKSNQSSPSRPTEVNVKKEADGEDHGESVLSLGASLDSGLWS